MLIRFKSPDPRAGSIVNMDGSRGRDFIEMGAAEEVRSDGTVVASSISHPHSAAGTPSSASPAAPVSQQTTVKPSNAGKKKGKAEASSS